MWALMVGPSGLLVDRSDKFDLEAFSIERSMNGRSVLHARTVDFPSSATTGHWKPNEFDIIRLIENGTDLIFSGLVQDVEAAPLMADLGTAASFSAADDNIYAEFAAIHSLTIPQGYTVKQAAQLIVPYLAPYNVSLAGDQVDGPAISADADIVLSETFASDILNQITQATGYNWRITYALSGGVVVRTLKLAQIATVDAPWTLDTTNPPLGDPPLLLAKLGSAYFNCQIVMIGTPQTLAQQEIEEGNGSKRIFTVHYYGPILNSEVVKNFGNPPGCDGEVYVATLGIYPADYGTHQWTFESDFNPGTLTGPGKIHQNPALGAALGVSNFLSWSVLVTYPMPVIAKDDAEIALKGFTKPAYSAAEDIFTYPEGLVIAQGRLRTSVVLPDQIKFHTRKAGLLPEQKLPVNLPNLLGGIADDFAIQNVNVRLPSQFIVQHEVTATSAFEYAGSWLDPFRRWDSGGGGGSIPAVSGSPGSAPTVTAVLHAHLGGSRDDFLTTASWTPIKGYATFKCGASGPYRVRYEVKTNNVGTSVQVRLYDLTASAEVAGSKPAASTSTDWVEQSGNVSLIEGHRYRAEVIGSNASAGIWVGQATVEV